MRVEGCSCDTKADASTADKDTKKNNVQLRFPNYIPNHQKLALELLKICKDSKSRNSLNSRSSDDNSVINDKYVDFKNCTFPCKHGKDVNVTLNLPEDTPCGPNGQTCAEKNKCVGHIPGC
ncbi:uncharacterized protein LOC120836618 [Ixodes scapularis]|uniref:uncharacterized protein LOC120836618 n=1 Tax=Ixodes scapularis TaxID=6945 RepID=UPI001C384CE8|nr:uncharacterized protein LOC120836618 [Ixodes scapularis]